jgi:hypothetical protein
VHSIEGLRRAAIAVRAGQVKLEAASGPAGAVAARLPDQAACAAILVNDEAADIEALLRQLVPVALGS